MEQPDSIDPPDLSGKSGHGFTRIKKLPAEQLQYLNNWLTRGGEVMALARHVQQTWKMWDDVHERTLCQQFNRYKKHLFETSNTTLPAMVGQDGVIVVKATRNRDIDPMERLVALVAVQEVRLQMFLSKEAQVKMPIAGVEKVIDSTKGILLEIQKMRFDLGMDEFRGVVPGGAIVRGAIKTVTAPDGSSTTSTLFEAVTTADQILGRAGIPSNLKLLQRNDDGSAG